MADHTTSVKFKGMLRSQGQEVTCVVSATKNVLPETDAIAYSNYGIKSVSEALPDGEYEMTANGETMRVRFRGAFWSITG